MSFEGEEETFYFNEDFDSENFVNTDSISEVEIEKYSNLFSRLDSEGKGFLEGSIPRDFLLQSGLPKFRLGLIWRLSDIDSDSRLNRGEFIIAMHLVVAALLGYPLPSKWNHPLPLASDNSVSAPNNNRPTTPNSNIPTPPPPRKSLPPQNTVQFNRASSSPSISRRPLPAPSSSPSPSPSPSPAKNLSNSPSQQRSNIPNTTSYEKTHPPPPTPPRTLSASQMVKKDSFSPQPDNYQKPLPVLPPSRPGSVNNNVSRPVSVAPPKPSKPAPDTIPMGGSLGRKSVLPPLPPTPAPIFSASEGSYPVVIPQKHNQTLNHSVSAPNTMHNGQRNLSPSDFSFSPSPPTSPSYSSSARREVVLEVAPGFFNVRGSFRYKGIINIGTHMSLAKLNNGKYLVIDAAPLSDQIKAELDELTDHGRLMEAVVHTHPFHTLAVPEFFAAYPNVPNYGTPRHLKKMPEFTWAGSVNDCKVQAKWRPDIEMRIPAGAEFADPLPEATNHFSSVFVLHKPSGTIHVDDTIMVCSNPGFILRAFGKMKNDTMMFHQSMTTVGLYKTAEAPLQFKEWMQSLINEWEFDNICGAHLGNKIGGAKKQLQQTLDAATPTLEKLSRRYANRKESKPGKLEPVVAEFNIGGCECG